MSFKFKIGALEITTDTNEGAAYLLNSIVKGNQVAHGANVGTVVVGRPIEKTTYEERVPDLPLNQGVKQKKHFRKEFFECVVCGERFKRRIGSSRTVCSKKCRSRRDRALAKKREYAKNYREKINYGSAMCLHCGKSFQKKKPDQVYCSRFCAGNANVGNARSCIGKTKQNGGASDAA